MKEYEYPAFVPHSITVHMLYTEQELYLDFPNCQRDYVWETRVGNQQKLIDSMLRGIPVPPIVMMRSANLFGDRYRTLIVDGQQRFRTILRYRNDEFATARRLNLEPGLHPMYAGLRYSELPPETRARFDGYPVQFVEVINVSIDLIGLIYRRLNYAVPCNTDEKLFSYAGPAKDLAQKLSPHPCWELYTGAHNRKQINGMCMIIIYLELMEGFANLTTPRLYDLASGSKDAEIKMSKDLETRIYSRLTDMLHVFKGIAFEHPKTVILLYQAMMLLSEMGYQIGRSPEGCLAKWFAEVIDESAQFSQIANRTLFAQMTSVVNQREFWNKHLVTICERVKVRAKDRNRKFSYNDSVRAWLRQGGVCSVCKKQISFRGVGHHLVAYVDGGETESKNCLLVHKDCHMKIHHSGQRDFLGDLSTGG